MTVEINDYNLTMNVLFFPPNLWTRKTALRKKCIINSNLLIPFSGPWPGHKFLKIRRSCSEAWGLQSFGGCLTVHLPSYFITVFLWFSCRRYVPTFQWNINTWLLHGTTFYRQWSQHHWSDQLRSYAKQSYFTCTNHTLCVYVCLCVCVCVCVCVCITVVSTGILCCYI